MEMKKAESFGSKYVLEDQIGSGASSVVFRCRRTSDDFVCAVKVIDIRHLQFGKLDGVSAFQKEINILRSLDHPNIVKTYECFEEDDQIFIVMEFIPGKELFETILELPMRFYPEEKAKPIIQQILEATKYLHSKNIIHRDIKPENIKLQPNDASPNLTVKLLDFGVAKKLDNELLLAQTFVGTPYYLAPEIEKARRTHGKYGPEVDNWSIGALLYVMLVGRFPEFLEEPGKSSRKVLFSPETWKNVSPEAVDLIKGLMNEDPQHRLKICDALQHVWLNGKTGEGEGMTNLLSSSETKFGSFASKFQVSQKMNLTGMSTTEISLNTSSSFDKISMAESSTGNKRPFSGASTAVVQEFNIKVKKQTLSHSTVPSQSEYHPSALIPIVDPALALLSESNHNNTTHSQLQNVDVNNIARFTGIGPMVKLQRSIANLFRNVLPAYLDNPKLASALRQGALLCREQVRENDKLLKKIHRVSGAILELFGDLDLAVEENEPELARSFFISLRKWVCDLSTNVKEAQTSQAKSTQQVHNLMEKSVCLGKSKVEDIETKIDEEMKQVLPTESVMSVNKETFNVVKELKNLTADSKETSLKEDELLDVLLPSLQKITDALQENNQTQQNESEDPEKYFALHQSNTKDTGEKIVDCSEDLVKLEQKTSDIKALVSKLLGDLYRIDQVMDHLATLWSNIEVVLDILLVRAEHVERFVKYAQKPKLLHRFRQRLAEYYRFWSGIQIVCEHFLGSSAGGISQFQPQVYSFLGLSEEEATQNSNTDIVSAVH